MVSCKICISYRPALGHYQPKTSSDWILSIKVSSHKVLQRFYEGYKAHKGCFQSWISLKVFCPLAVKVWDRSNLPVCQMVVVAGEKAGRFVIIPSSPRVPAQPKICFVSFIMHSKSKTASCPDHILSPLCCRLWVLLTMLVYKQNTKNLYSLKVLETGSHCSRCWQTWFLMRVLFLDVGSRLHPVSCWGSPMSPPACENPSLLSPVPHLYNLINLNCLPKSPISKYGHRRFSTWILKG